MQKFLFSQNYDIKDHIKLIWIKFRGGNGQSDLLNFTKQVLFDQNRILIDPVFFHTLIFAL